MSLTVQRSNVDFRSRVIAPALIVGLGVLVALLSGPTGFMVYLLFALILLGGVYSLGFFGDWIQRTSRGRFDDDAWRRR